MVQFSNAACGMQHKGGKLGFVYGIDKMGLPYWTNNTGTDAWLEAFKRKLPKGREWERKGVTPLHREQLIKTFPAKVADAVIGGHTGPCDIKCLLQGKNSDLHFDAREW